MRFFGLLLGLLLLLAASGCLAYDLAALAAERPFRLTPLGQIWYDLDRASLNGFQVLIERYVWAPLWQSGVSTVLQWPAVFVFLAPGLVLVPLCWRRRRGPRRR